MDKTPVSAFGTERIYTDIENQIRNNQFSSKEALNQYLINLRRKGILISENQKEIQELLALYDSLNVSAEIPLDMEKYKSVELEEQNLIISTEDDKVLKTQESTETITDEFKSIQNTITANNHDGLVNADTVFNHMANNQKEELSLIPISEVFTHDDIDIEILKKIRFFLGNKYINPYDFRIDIQTGIFYNHETNEALEVRINKDTNQYEIYRGNELLYGSIQEEYTQTPLESEKEEEKEIYDTLNQPKKRVLRPPSPNDQRYNRAAFTSVSFLVINIITFALLITMIVLLNK